MLCRASLLNVYSHLLETSGTEAAAVLGRIFGKAIAPAGGA